MPSSSPDPNTPQLKQGYLFGHPISHSLSPLVHNTVFHALSLAQTYTLYESASIPSFLSLTQDPNFYGAAVTMPHKVAIIPHLSSLTPEGTAVGAINTVFPVTNPRTGERELVGTNTDCIGIREALRRNMRKEEYAACRGRPALIVGGGGTSRAAVYALTQWVGSSAIYMLNRDADEVRVVIEECSARGFGTNLVHIESLSQAKELEPPAVIISAIPDFPPETEGEKMVRECLSALLETGSAALLPNGNAHVLPNGDAAAHTPIPNNITEHQPQSSQPHAPPFLLEMCYHPTPNTSITRLARAKNWTVIPGTEAMIWQGLEQDRYWTGEDVAGRAELVEEVKRVVGEALERAWKGAGKGGHV
jgi:quinate dehydrogenase